jgi:hypothetical protein
MRWREREGREGKGKRFGEGNRGKDILRADKSS